MYGDMSMSSGSQDMFLKEITQNIALHYAEPEICIRRV